MASPRKIGKKSKHKDHHFKEQSITLTKRSKSNAINQPPEPHRTVRAGAGSGGRALQLEKVGAALEAPNRLPKTTTTLPSRSLANPLAPVPAKRGKKKLPVQVHEAHFFHWCTNSCSHRFLHHLGPIDLSFSMIFYFLLVFLGNKHMQLLHGASPSVYLNSGPHDRFGFNPSPPIVPPGMEPNLQALNNPYIAAVRSQSKLWSPHTLGSQSLSNQVERDMNTNPTIPVIDPALEAMSMPSSTY